MSKTAEDILNERLHTGHTVGFQRREIIDAIEEYASLRSKEDQEEIQELKKHRDEKEVMIQAFNKICNLFNGYKWIIEGRGPYAYDDAGYRLEVTHLFTEFQFIRQDTWDNIQSRTADYKHALLKDAQDYVAEMLRIKLAGRDQTIELQRKRIEELSALSGEATKENPIEVSVSYDAVVKSVQEKNERIQELVEGLKSVKDWVPQYYIHVHISIDALIHKHTPSESKQS